MMKGTVNISKAKNLILLCTPFIHEIRTFFYGTTLRCSLGVLIERSTRLDFFFMYYGFAIDFLVLAYCMHYPKGIDRRVTRCILVITALDLIHLFLFSGQVFGLTKLGIAIVICLLYELKIKYGEL